MNFSEFLESKYSNVWIDEPHMKVYVRRAVHLLGPNMACRCLDIGSVEVDEHMRGNGVFKAFLQRFELEAEKRDLTVFVESIMEPRLSNFLQDKGYKISPYHQPPAISCFKLPTKPTYLTI
jgi:N-acetylglutamate synthase-like GNAT family acetyltransferase